MRAQLQALVKRSYACERAGACTVNFARPIMVLLGSALGFERFRSPLGSRVPIARTRASAAAKIYNSLVRVRAHNPCVCIALVRVRAPVGKGAFRSYACVPEQELTHALVLSTRACNSSILSFRSYACEVFSMRQFGNGARTRASDHFSQSLAPHLRSYACESPNFQFLDFALLRAIALFSHPCIRVVISYVCIYYVHI